MREYTKLAAIVLIVILATTLLGASFQMINVRAYMPGLGSLFSDDSLPGSSSGDGNTGSGAGGRPGQPGTGTPSEPPATGPTEPPLSAGEKLATLTSLSSYDDVLSKGNTFAVSGKVTDAVGKTVAGVPVYLYLSNNSSGQEPVFCGAGTSTMEGFYARASVPAQIGTGNYTLLAKSQETNRYLGSEDTADVRVMAQTLLGITLPSAAVAGEAFPAEVRLTEKASGSPLAGMPVTISAGLYTYPLTTDDLGMARTNVSFPSAGDHTVLAGFEGNGDYSRSTATIEVPVTPKPGQSILSQPWAVLSIFIGLLLLAVTMVAGALLVLRNARKPPGAKAVQVATPTQGLPLPTPLPGYKIEFEGIDAALPAVWGVDEPLRILVSAPGDAGDTLELFVDGEAIERVKISGGTGHSVLQFTNGEHQVTIQAGSTALAAANIRIVDYREEIVHIFNGLYASLRAKSEGIAEDMTPRELQSAVSAGLPPEKRKGLDQIVSIFEIANYSTHTVSREDYIHSFVLIQELQT